MAKIIGITIFVFGFLAILATYQDLLPFYVTNNNHEKIESLWRQDLELLVKTGSLPKQFKDVAEVKYFPLSSGTKSLLENIKPPFTKKIEGGYRLEITLDDWSEVQTQKDEYGLMIQYNLINIESGNTVWELGRTLVFKN